jgi:hypothetical protein
VTKTSPPRPGRRAARSPPIFWAFWHAREAGESSFTAYSPATKQDYDLTCTTGSLVTCRAGDGAEVQFPLTAVQAYSSAQADRYAATHDTGEAPEPEPPPKPRPPEDGGANCDPNYTGQCLDPNAYDYDCEGGTGDGPKYTGPVRVVGDDPYDLDRDGDGVACETVLSRATAVRDKRQRRSRCSLAWNVMRRACPQDTEVV